MLTVFDRPETSKDWYFKISGALNFSYPMKSDDHKVAGLYAIYKNNICLYVGQSKNIPSRLSTHLTGRYEVCDDIRIFYVCEEEHFEGFYSWSSKEQTQVLESNEAKLINILKPTENIMVNREADINEDDLFYHIQSLDHESDHRHSMQILLSKHYVTAIDDLYGVCEGMDDRFKLAYNEWQKHINLMGGR